LAKRDITIDTEDGRARTGVFMPADAGDMPDNQPGIVLYMDAFGPRPALDAMAERLAGAGYVVLVPDLFYRHGAYGPFNAGTAFAEEETRDEIRGMMGATTQAMTERDSAAFIDQLTRQGASGPIGVVGYCMGGARALTAAAAYPDRIRAAASIHGGNLASDAPDSPHLRAASIAASVYVATAGVDRSFPPEQSGRLAVSLREAGVDHMIENYVGMSHGWAVPDHQAFDETGAERHWKRLLTLFAEALQ
jgi:carboxymethylenebutenolidase